MRLLLLTLGLAASLGTSGCATDATARLPASQMPGTYSSGDGLGRTVVVHVHPDGTYRGDWSGCLGTDGRSAGTWSLSGERLQFQPHNESGRMRGYLGRATVLRHGGRIGFARDQEVDNARIDADQLFLRE